MVVFHVESALIKTQFRYPDRVLSSVDVPVLYDCLCGVGNNDRSILPLLSAMGFVNPY